jgi:hypothetical protein
MTGSSRAELLRRLNDLMELCPEKRFGQLIANLAVVARGTGPEAAWEMEDEELIARRQYSLFHRLRKVRVVRPTLEAPLILRCQRVLVLPDVDTNRWVHRRGTDG